MRLALNLGKTLYELGRDTDSEELSTWIAFDRICPLPDPWLQTGTMVALMANLWKGPKCNKVFKALDFIPIVRRAVHSALTPKQRDAKLRAWVHSFKPLNNRKKGDP